MAAQKGRYQLRGAVPVVGSATISATEKQFGVRLRQSQSDAERRAAAKPKKFHQIVMQKLRGNTQAQPSTPTKVIITKKSKLDRVTTGAIAASNSDDDEDDDEPTVVSSDDNSGMIYKGDPNPEENAAKAAPEDDDKNSDDEGFDVTARLAGSIGYDSNIDASEDKADSGFHRYDAAFEAVYDVEDLKLNATMEATTKAFFGRDSINEWKLDLGVDGRYKLGSDWYVGFGIGRDHNFLDEDDASISNTAFVEVGHEGETLGLEIRAASDYNVDRSLEAEDDADDDTVTASLATTFRLKPKAALSPFIRAGVDHLTYVARESDDDDEDVTAYSVLAGLRIKPDDRLQIDIAGRFEWRDYSSPDTENLTNVFADVDLKWNPNENFGIKGGVHRSLDSPSSDTSDYLENTEYSLGLNWNVTEKTEFELGGSLELSRESDDSEASQDISLEAKISQELTNYLGVFAQAQQTWSRSETDGLVSEEYERFEVWAGLELKL